MTPNQNRSLRIGNKGRILKSMQNRIAKLKTYADVMSSEELKLTNQMEIQLLFMKNNGIIYESNFL